MLITRNKSDVINSFKLVAKSWHTTIALDEKNIKERIDNHIKSAKHILSFYNIPYVEINYDDYISKPHDLAAILSEISGISINKKELGYRSKANHSSWSGKTLFLINHIYSGARKIIVFPVKYLVREKTA